MRLDAEAIHRRIADLLRERHSFSVASITGVKGSCPQKPGARMIVLPDGKIEFTIGGGPFEAEVVRDALAVRTEAGPVTREYKLTKSDLGMYCQGLVTVLIENYIPRPRLLLFGGGHVGQALSRITAASGLFHVTVVDDRAEYADRSKHPDAEEVIHTDRNFERDVPSIDSQTYMVVVTRCHATDMLLIRRYLQAPAAYLGLIGSKPKIRQFRRELTEEGIAAQLLDRVYAPIGLPIGGKDPSEVAVSILAEIIQVKNRVDAASCSPVALSV